ncbi:RHS repeat-associated core domain-containing protein [Candidatus Binatus sp.]|uniref:RHS repeat-associated core domain-containing protein n=1 Tax=Candidatus Binatus sp. TaxID=2811406 RepID=UPI002F9503C1
MSRLRGAGSVSAGARYYNPQLARFISEDPERGKANLFDYASDNAITGSDLSGMDDCPGGDCGGTPGAGGYSQNQGSLSYGLGSILQLIFNFFFPQSTSAVAVSQVNYAKLAQLGRGFGGSFQTIGLQDGTNVYSHGGGVDRLANILFRETSVLTGDNIDTARIAMGHALINGSRTPHPPTHASGAPLTGLNPRGQRLWNECFSCAQAANSQDAAGIDPTHGAIHFNNRTTAENYPNKKLRPPERPTMIFGPFDNAVNRYRYIDIYP